MKWAEPPFSIPLHCSGGGAREFRIEVKPRKKGRVGGRCF